MIPPRPHRATVRSCWCQVRRRVRSDPGDGGRPRLFSDVRGSADHRISGCDRCPGHDDARLADRCRPRCRHDRDRGRRRPDRDRVHRRQLRWLVEELLRVGDMLHGGSVGCRGRRRLMGQPVQLGEGFRRMRHEQEVREHELRRLRADLHAELHELRNPLEPGVLAALETLRGRVRR